MIHEICAKALEYYGGRSQTLMLFEEMSELQKEICKNARGEDNTRFIAEEIADVEIMLEQMKQLYDCRQAVEQQKHRKLLRLKERMGG